MTDAPRYDLHLHSRHSNDSLTRPKSILAAARRRGLAGIAVTDHGTMDGALETSALAPSDLLVIIGAEIYTDVGDLLCLFLKEPVRSINALEVIAEVHGQGGLVFLPHPLRSHPPVIPAQILHACDGFEALNGRAGWFDPASAAGGANAWEALRGKPRIGGSDGHFAAEIGRAWTAIPGPTTPDNVRSSLAAGRTVAGGEVAPAASFYLSQLVKLGKTRDLGMLVRLVQRAARKLS